MGLNFRKRIKLGKLLSLNLGKSSASLSVGVKGAHYSVSTTGKRRATVGIPGTGVSYTKSFGGKKSSGKSGSKDRDSDRSEVRDKKENEQKVEEWNRLVEHITGIHEECDKVIDWNTQGGIPLSLRGCREGVLNGEIDAYYEVIEKTEPLDDLLDYGSEFEIGTDRADALTVEFRVKTDEVVPKTELVLTQAGNLSEKELSKTRYYELVQDYVCSCSIRVARDLFALLPVDRVLVNAVDEGINKATGHKEEITCLSVIFTRKELENLGFEQLDPSEAMANFPYCMNFKKTQGFLSVNRLEL